MDNSIVKKGQVRIWDNHAYIILYKIESDPYKDDCDNTVVKVSAILDPFNDFEGKVLEFYIESCVPDEIHKEYMFYDELRKLV